VCTKPRRHRSSAFTKSAGLKTVEADAPLADVTARVEAALQRGA
jgi:hypothetical protein